MNRISTESILLDETQALFNVVFILACFFALEKNDFKYYILAGLSLSCSYLTRELALIGIPLPIMLIILYKKYRTRKNMFGLFIYSAFFILIGYLPWKAYLVVNKGSNYLIKQVLDKLSIKEFFNYEINPLTFLKRYIIPEFGSIIFILFIISWLIAIYFALKGNGAYGILVISLLLFVGLAAHISIVFFNVLIPRYFLAGFFISYLLLGKVLFSPIKWGYERLKGRTGYLKFVISISCIIPLITVFSIQLWTAIPHWHESIKHGNFKNWDTALARVGVWINSNLPRRPLYVNDTYYGSTIHFTSGGYPMYFSHVRGKNIDNYDQSEGSLINIYLDSENNVKVISEKDLFEEIYESRAKYIIIYQPNWYKSINLYSSYVEKSENFKLIKKISGDETISIYETKKGKKIFNAVDFKHQKFIDQMRSILNTDKAKYEAIKKDLLDANLGYLLHALEKKAAIKEGELTALIE